MSGLNEIKSSIDNVKGTRKITRAMYLISASKSRSSRAQLEKTLKYFNKIATVLSEIIAETEDLDTPYINDTLQNRSDMDLYLVLAGDKGQAGGYNQNILHLLERYVNKNKDLLWVAGHAGRSLIRRKGFQVSEDFKYQVMSPNLFRAREVAEQVAGIFLSGNCRRVYLVYTDMESALRLEPKIAQLLPLKPEDLTHHAPMVDSFEKAVYEPNPKAVFEHLAPYYLKGILYGAFVDAFSSEQNARMLAMDSATKNASDMIRNLSQHYNRVRQSKITQEINEIVGGIPTE